MLQAKTIILQKTLDFIESMEERCWLNFMEVLEVLFVHLPYSIRISTGLQY